MLDKAVSERVVHDYKVRQFSPNSHALRLVVLDSLSKRVHLQAVLVGTLVVSCGFLQFPSPWTVFKIVSLHALCDPLKPLTLTALPCFVLVIPLGHFQAGNRRPADQCQGAAIL